MYADARQHTFPNVLVRTIRPRPTSQEPPAVATFHLQAGDTLVLLSKANFRGPSVPFAGHPLARRGLHPYRAFEVRKSSWIRALEKMNSVHPSHRQEHFDGYRHFILAFHDTTFECVATGYTHELAAGPLNEFVARETARLAE